MPSAKSTGQLLACLLIVSRLGLNESALTFSHDGRFKRLTDLGGRVLDDVLA
jgi:hypothetical protein